MPCIRQRIAGEYAYSLVLLLLPLAIQAKGLMALCRDGHLVSATLVVGTFVVFGVMLLLALSKCQELAPALVGRCFHAANLAGHALVMLTHVVMSGFGGKCSWGGPKSVMACVVAYSLAVTALLSWPLAALLAIFQVPMLTLSRPLPSLFRGGPYLLMMSLVCAWAFLVPLVNGNGDGDVLANWIRWYNLAGLINLPLLCLVFVPAHLTTAFVLSSPPGPA